ncbi:MAG: hypothetical protein ACK5LN_00245 [Propioniciclava sp.]
MTFKVGAFVVSVGPWLGVAPALGELASKSEVSCKSVKAAQKSGDEIDLEVGDIIRDGIIGAQVQKPGVSVTAAFLGVNKSYELTVGTALDGSLVVESCGEDSVEEVSMDGPLAIRNFGSAATASASSPGQCADTAYSLHGYKWNSTLRWRYKADTTPSGLSVTNVVNALTQGTRSITQARNTCNMADNIPVTQQYLGTGGKWSNISGNNCLWNSNGVSTVDFAGGGPNVLAGTCTWNTNGHPQGNGIAVESDVRFNKVYKNWKPTAAGSCGGRYVIRAVMAHERGHSYGINHVNETNHGRLTMSTSLDGPCQEQEFWLGRGDVLSLRARYGV